MAPRFINYDFCEVNTYWSGGVFIQGQILFVQVSLSNFFNHIFRYYLNFDNMSFISSVTSLGCLAVMILPSMTEGWSVYIAPALFISSLIPIYPAIFLPLTMPAEISTQGP